MFLVKSTYIKLCNSNIGKNSNMYYIFWSISVVPSVQSFAW